MNILYVYADSKNEWNCSEIRCMVPARAFRLAKVQHRWLDNHDADAIHITDWSLGKDEAKKKSEWADVIVVQRLFLGPSLVAIEYWKARGKTVIGDVDDAYAIMPKSVPTYAYWRKGEYLQPSGQYIKLKYLPAVQQVWGGKLCHGISAPSEVLLRDWDKLVDKTILVPNYIETERFLNIEKPPFDPDKIVIGWGGSISHNDSFRFSSVVDGLIQLMVKFPNVHLHLAGGVGEIAMMFKKRAPLDRVHILKWTAYDVWPYTLSKFNIGIVPLSGAYDNRRSPIKALEYALMGIPWVGSKAPIYDVFSSFGIQVDNAQSHWYQALKEVVTNYEEWKSKQEEAKEIAISWDIGSNLQSIVETYRVVADSAKLTKRLE